MHSGSRGIPLPLGVPGGYVGARCLPANVLHTWFSEWKARVVGKRQERPNETLARHVVSTVLGLPVDPYDDGSRDAMVDGIIRLPRADAALEIVSDEDGEFLALWNALERMGHKTHVPGLSNAWWVQVRRAASVKGVVAGLPDLLRELEARALSDLHQVRRAGAWHLKEQAHGIGIRMASRIDGNEPPGRVRLLVEGWSGGVGGPDFASFVEGLFVAHPDVARKLAAHDGASERHAFWWVTLASDMAVQFGLEDRGDALPAMRDPVLPEGVSHVWVAGRNSSQGTVAWFPDRGWWRTPWQWPSRDPATLEELYGSEDDTWA